VLTGKGPCLEAESARGESGLLVAGGLSGLVDSGGLALGVVSPPPPDGVAGVLGLGRAVGPGRSLPVEPAAPLAGAPADAGAGSVRLVTVVGAPAPLFSPRASEAASPEQARAPASKLAQRAGR
jgi:hypothetical protein